MDWSTVQHFTEAELACNCCDNNHMDADFVERLDAMRKRLGFPFEVTSGYRCPKHNERVSSTGVHGPHTTGRAVDIKAFGPNAYEIINWARAFGMTGIGLSQKGHHARRFIHLDNLEHAMSINRNRPWVWTY